MGTYRLFPSTDGPSTAVSYGGPFASGVGFEVTASGAWFEGYWWWVCASGQPSQAQPFALWQVLEGGRASIVSNATVTSGTLVPGQWNYISLPEPVMLSVGGGQNFAQVGGGGTAFYIACTALTGGFPGTDQAYGPNGPYAAGITNGPLTAFSDTPGSLPAPFGVAQGLFSTSGNVTSGAPFGGASSENFWMDVQISDTVPPGYSGSYRIWPNMPVVPGTPSNDEGQQTFGTEFWLSEPCAINNVWFWSPPGATVLPSRCGIFSVTTRTEVAGTGNSSPAWSGAAGSGWVSCSYSDAILPSGKYKVCVYTDGGAVNYQENINYFSTGPGNENIVAGPVTVPTNANASSCVSGAGSNKGQTVTGNSTYQDGPWSYPDTFDSNDAGETRWVDVEVTPSNIVPPPPPMEVNPGAFLAFFP